ncbi:hypothetical protein TrST_g9072 [Triparma strigata]|uniref:Acyltransferase n=1 Tax=Triparma strigata TaxID=1606541 RepID=A0A9W6ZXC6_9STRA|nr:hypothetical protein TrST_g9072 [Triparma strigata]
MRPPALPMLSELILLTMNCITALFALLLPTQLQAIISSFMVGGLFGLFVPPLLVLHGSLLFFKTIFSADIKLSYIYATLLILYIATVLTGKQATTPPPLGAYRKPKNSIEELSLKFWSSHFDYFPMTIIKQSGPSTKLDPSKQYIFAVHPHGIHCWALNALAFTTSPFHKNFPGFAGKVTGLAATVIFQIPVVRELFLSMGYCDAGRSTAHKILKSKRSMFVCTGGEEESMLTSPGSDYLVLKKRKGFVRLAIIHQTPLVPVFGLGISDLYTTYSFLLPLTTFIQKKTGVALPIFHGRYLTPLPYKVPIKILIGTPIPPPKNTSSDPMKADPALVDELHQKYIEAVKELHKKHADNRKLTIL